MRSDMWTSILALALATCSSALELVWRAPGVARPRARVITLSADGLQDKQREAARLLALAAEAEAEARELERQAQALKPKSEVGSLEKTPTNQPVVDSSDEEPMVLTAPLRWIGPYPAVALSFPGLSSPTQKARQLAGDASASGVTLDFVLDTAANTNTVSAQVAAPTNSGGLALQAIGAIGSGVGAGGLMGGGTTYMLGTAELADVPAAERVPFVTGLTATALPVAAPAAAGLLGVPFLNSFPGGVEFLWGRGPTGGAEAEVASDAAGVTAGEMGALDATPSLRLYGDEGGIKRLREELSRVPLTALVGSGLPRVTLVINGIEMPALLDTGSPITVLNAAAAAAAGLQAADGPAAPDNPFAKLAAGLEAAKAAARGDVLTVAGAEGPVSLKRCAAASISFAEGIHFGDDCRPYVGDLPGLAALEGLGAAARPAVVLGTDVLCRRPRLWYTPEAIYI
jgi:hypothetical protein